MFSNYTGAKGLIVKVSLSMVLSLLLVACGGGGGDDPSSSNNTGDTNTVDNNNGGAIVNGSLPAGEVLMTTNVGASVEGSAALADDGTIYVFTVNGFGLNGFIFAINPDGGTKWAVDTGASYLGSFSTPAIGVDGTIYVAANDLLAIDTDGSVKWQFPLVTYGSSPAIAADGTIYVVDDFGVVYAVNPDGSEKWSLTTGVGATFAKSMTGIAIDGNGNLYFGTEDDTVISIDSAGALRWNNDYALNEPLTPSIGADGRIYIYFAEGGYIAAIEPDGTAIWSKQINSAYGYGSSVTIDSDGTLYVANGEDPAVIYALNPDGSTKWSRTLTDDVIGAPAISDIGTIYIADIAGNFWALNDDGSVKWKIDGVLAVGGTTAPPAIGDDGAVYFVDGTGSVFVVSTDATGMNSGPWPTHMRDANNTSRAD